MNKKYILIMSLFLVIALIGLFLIFNKKEETLKGALPFSSFEVKELGGITLIENDISNLSFILPQDWDLSESSFSSLTMKSKDFVPLDNYLSGSFVPQKGCRIDLTVRLEEEGTKEDIFYTENKKLIDSPEVLEDLKNKDNDYQIIEVSGVKALYHGIKNGDLGVTSLIRIPINNIVYMIESYLFGENKDACTIDFNKLLETVSITNK